MIPFTIPVIANYLTQAYLHPDRLELNKTLLFSSSVGKSEQLKTTLEGYDTSYSPLQIVTASPPNDVLATIRDYINHTLCSSGNYQDNQWLGKILAKYEDPCSDLKDINFEALVHSYNAVVDLLAAYQKTHDETENIPNTRFYDKLKANLMSDDPFSNMSFDETGEVHHKDYAPVLSFSLMKKKHPTSKYYYAEVCRANKLLI